MVKIVRGIVPVELAHRKCGQSLNDDAVGVPVYQRHRIPAVRQIYPVIGMDVLNVVQRIHDGGVLHLNGFWRLKIYVVGTERIAEQCTEFKSSVHRCYRPPRQTK